MAWIYRALEQADGSWACRHGLHEYDRHPSVQEALVHLTELAGGEEPFVLYLHPLHGAAHAYQPGESGETDGSQLPDDPRTRPVKISRRSRRSW